ncbi:protein FAM83E isoform X1 [Eublepharis macularius]|uniref:Protein FAM83E isoform X1 n=1 Tax=Eublepharis macularius TaxID=481883 RepID=A0AA97K9Q1_EUBMA|nr:protein FAM83E isoform X1 [Eublepharis macularius]
MAGSQVHCLESEEPYAKVTESNPEFYYSEGQRLALEALLAKGKDAFKECLVQEKLRPFLSDGEQQELEEATTAENSQDFPSSGAGRQNHGDKGSSLSYWPGRSDEPTPDLELGWPDNGAWKGITRAEVYTHPPGERAPHIKEVVRRCLQQANKVIAIVMDVFTDPDILSDLYDAAVRRRVPVYIILSRQHLDSFLIMAEKMCLNVRYTEMLRVRVIQGCTFQTRLQKQVTGLLKEKFVLADGDVVITGSYSFTWTDARLNRHLVTRLTGEVTEAFDREFRTLYAASCSLLGLEVPPKPQVVPTLSLPTTNGPEPAPYISILDGVQLSSNRIAERRSVAPQPVAKSRAGEWELVLASPATAEDPALPTPVPEVSIRNRLGAWHGMDLSGRAPQGCQERHSALSDIFRNVQRSRLSVAKTTGARASKSLWDLSRFSQLSGSSTGFGHNGIESSEEAKKWAYQNTPARELMKQRGAGHPPDEPRIPVYLAHGRMTPSPGYPGLGRLQGQLYRTTAHAGVPRAWGHSGKPSHGHQLRF